MSEYITKFVWFYNHGDGWGMMESDSRTPRWENDDMYHGPYRLNVPVPQEVTGRVIEAGVEKVDD